jgi:hypothetical protein
MSAFDEREQGFEKRYALGEELRFKALARRNRLLGLWAAEQLGLTGDASKAYSDALIERQVERADDEALTQALADAFTKAKLDISRHRIARKMEQTMAQATKEISEGR